MDFQSVGRSIKGTNLVKLQRDQLENILSSSKRDEEVDGCVWKVLIFDTFCQNMLSTVLKVGNLRELNITLHLHITSKGEKRERLHGMKAFYLIQPTSENLQLIKDDFTKDLYDQVYIHFCSPASDELLRSLAVHVGSLNAVYKIKRVMQHSVGFVTLAQDLFTLNIPNSYANTHNFINTAIANKSSETINQAAVGLFAVFRSLKQVPTVFFKSEERNSELLASELARLFEENYINSQEFEDEQSDFLAQNKSPPILILSERDSDLGSQLLHPWHYAALVHDIYKIENNKIAFTEPPKELNSAGTTPPASQKIETRTFDLDCSGEDSYWAQNMNAPFPDVANDIGECLAKWEIEYKNLLSKKDDPTQMLAAMGSINDMQDKKRLIEMYMAVSSGIMYELKSRQLDKYFEAGAAILRDKQLRPQEKKDLLAIFEDNTIPSTPKSELDKLRVLIIYLLFVNDIDQNEFLKLQNSAGIQNKTFLKILEQFKQKRIPNYQGTAVEATAPIEEDSGDNFGGLLGKLANKVKSQGKGLLNNVINYLPGTEQDFELARNLRQLVESKCLAYEKLGYKFIDILNKNNQTAPPKQVSDLVVFVVDGANLNEFQNAQEVLKKLGKSLIYGGSEILNAETFISQLTS